MANTNTCVLFDGDSQDVASARQLSASKPEFPTLDIDFGSLGLLTKAEWNQVRFETGINNLVDNGKLLTGIELPADCYEEELVIIDKPLPDRDCSVSGYGMNPSETDLDFYNLLWECWVRRDSGLNARFVYEDEYIELALWAWANEYRSAYN